MEFVDSRSSLKGPAVYRQLYLALSISSNESNKDLSVIE